ncbi:BDN_1c_G0032260.mRNA.1.CDS.1 [Saccharomyces cerevisiae]|nr:BDN_1c_G0032260.mRNA.1.CDS.1 [Saccharomyces cerevisiae]CAI7306586.1 BDN_1c_G0032260.mRNA.1.CDS.1 [Saccharomyces cerevisiae]
MNTSSRITYFIIGGSRGIGFNLVKILSASTGNTVITSIRGSPSLPKNKQVEDLAKIRKNIHIIKKTPFFLGIDIFIACSAVSDSYYKVLETPKSVWLNHYSTNALGPILALQKVYPLLLLKKTRKIFFISSVAGSINAFVPLSVSAYGQSKAALNYAVKTLSFELKPEGFTVVAFHPGMVSTDMGQYGIDHFKEKNIDISGVNIITPEESASALIDVFRKILPEDNGKFFTYDGSEGVF